MRMLLQILWDDSSRQYILPYKHLTKLGEVRTGAQHRTRLSCLSARVACSLPLPFAVGSACMHASIGLGYRGTLLRECFLLETC